MSSASWSRPLLLVSSVLVLLGWFSPEIRDPDFWWHLRTGQYIWQTHSLPVPDPFAYTTAGAGSAYPGETATRRFNLTHEWLAQVILYVVYAASGFAGLVLFRALLLAGFCGIVGLAAYHRCGGFYRALLAAFAAAAVTVQSGFNTDRPYIFTFLFLALTLAILEFRRGLWLLPPLFLVWANCHGGFFLGWIVLGACCAESLLPGSRGTPQSDRRRLWSVSAVSVLVSGLNPNGFRVVQTLLDYRSSYLTSRLLEWGPPSMWPPQVFALLLLAAAAVLLRVRGKARLSDWLLFAAFGAAALTAQRNTFLVAVIAPMVIVSYVTWKRPVAAVAPFAAAALLLLGLAVGIARGSVFQLHAAEWKYPSGAVRFLEDHHVTGPTFNTYEYGGYLIWRLGPGTPVFIDGRALSESVFMDYSRILYNHDSSDGGKTAQALLDQYQVQAIVMNCFEYSNGLVYVLAPALADPQQTEWKLVYSDPEALVFVRHPPQGVEPLDSLKVLDHMEAECDLHIRHEPQWPRCARGLGQVFYRIGDFTRARRWIGVYLAHPHEPDAEAERTYQQLLGTGK